MIGSAISAAGMRWGMVTNGILLESKLNSLLDSGISSISLSLDGIKDTHNKIRNNPIAFRRVTRAIKLIGKTEIPFKDVVTCVFPENLDQLDEIAEFLKDTGITSWRLFRIFQTGRAKNRSDLMLNNDLYWKMIDWIKTNKPKLKSAGINLNLGCDSWLPFEVDKKVRDFPFFCRAGINFASILSNGDITGCNNCDSAFHTANILMQDFSSVWESGFDEFRNRNWLGATTCHNCLKINECQGSSMHVWQKGNNSPDFCPNY
jgi:radical SAM protein with 4Fe4S-binding SPASM domain